MKTKVILLAILSLAFVFTSCDDDDVNIVPSDNVTTVEVSVSDFDKLSVSDIFKVYVTFSETEESVHVESNDNIHSVIDIYTQGNDLNIGLDENTKISGIPVLNAYIKTASLDRIRAMGASYIEFQNPLLGNTFKVDLEGACMFVGELEVDELVADILGASEMNISGNSEQFDIRAEGASMMTGFNFAANKLTANIYGASNISLTVNQELNVTASGASNVFYIGDGLIEYQKLSDTSKIVKVD